MSLAYGGTISYADCSWGPNSYYTVEVMPKVAVCVSCEVAELDLCTGDVSFLIKGVSQCPGGCSLGFRFTCGWLFACP